MHWIIQIIDWIVEEENWIIKEWYRNIIIIEWRTIKWLRWIWLIVFRVVRIECFNK